MSIRQYLAFLLYGTIISWCAWFIILFSIDPSTTNAIGKTVFHLTLFIATLGSISTISTLFRLHRDTAQSVELVVKTSLRQGLFLAIIIESCLFLLRFGWLTWWSTLLIIFVIALVESFFLHKAHPET